VVQRPEPELLASAIVECERRGAELRYATREWYAENETRLALETSLVAVVKEYGTVRAGSEELLEGAACVG